VVQLFDPMPAIRIHRLATGRILRPITPVHNPAYRAMLSVTERGGVEPEHSLIRTAGSPPAVLVY
jgi:hypothetical protein